MGAQLNPKTILNDPPAAMALVWGSAENCPRREQVMELSKLVLDCKRRLKQVKGEKGRIAGQFKEAAGDPERIDGLKAEMAAVSSKVKDLDDQRKSLEKELLDCFAAEDREKKHPSLPPRFSRPLPDSGPAEFDVSLVDDRMAKPWDDYVRSHPGASQYHLYGWKTVVQRAFGHQCFYFAARTPSGDVVGVLPLVRINSRLFGDYAVSLPFFNYGGTLADSRPITEKLMAAAHREADRLGWQHIEYRCCEPGGSLPVSNRKVSMVLPLPNEAEALERQLGAKVRAQYRQAEKHGPGISFGGIELLDEFYQVFSRNMRDLGTPVYSRDFFESILRQFPQTTIVCARLNSRPAGAAILSGFNDMLEIPWASTLRDCNRTNLNMWMYRRILDHAVQRGYEFFDFGRSSRDSGTYRFKKQWGARPVEHHWYYYLPRVENRDEAKLPGLNPDNPKYRLAIETWKKLPLSVANTLGPHIVKNLP